MYLNVKMWLMSIAARSLGKKMDESLNKVPFYVLDSDPDEGRECDTTGPEGISVNILFPVVYLSQLFVTAFPVLFVICFECFSFPSISTTRSVVSLYKLHMFMFLFIPA